nr:MAG TPA: hypothetical protein [Caudoviricetes sp.]
MDDYSEYHRIYRGLCGSISRIPHKMQNCFSEWGSRGRKFESSHPDIEAIEKSLLFLYFGADFRLLWLKFMPYST